MSDNQQYLEGVMDIEYMEKACEAVLFACGSAVSFDKIAIAVGVSINEIPTALNNLKERYKNAGSSVELIIYDGYAQFATKAEYGEIVRTALELRKNQPLSKAALEVLAIIAYNQPATRAFIDRVRGVESPSVVASLAEKGLIEEKGRLDAPGRPVLYGTTPVFLRTFGLASTDELGELPELEEIRKIYEEQFKAEKEKQQELDLGNTSVQGDEPSDILSDGQPVDPPREGVVSDANDEDNLQIIIEETIVDED